MACSTTRLVPSRLGLGFFLVLERVGMAHSGTNGTEPSRSAIFKLTHYRNFEPARTLPLDNNFAVRQTQFDLPNVTTRHIRFLGDQCCALQAAAGSARRNVFATVNANGCRRWIEVGLKHARMICFALGRFKRRVRRDARKRSCIRV